MRQTIEKARVALRYRTIVCIGVGVAIFVALAACGISGNSRVEDNSPATPKPQPPTPQALSAHVIENPAQPKEPEDLWTKAELEAMALTLAGECYDDKEQDKRKVCEVILNRVSSDEFPDSILDVITAPNQFNGYWTQSRPVSENDYEVAEQALWNWYDNDCEPLSQWLFFTAGENRENEFRDEF